MTLPLPWDFRTHDLSGERLQDTFDLIAQVPSRPVFVTALPSAPQDGQEVYYRAADSNNQYVFWHLKYRSASTETYKWEFIGGPPIGSAIDTSETTTSSTYTALTTAGPSVTVPLAGDYDVQIGCRAANGAAGVNQFMSFDVGATGALDADAVVATSPAANYVDSVFAVRRKTGLAASTALVAKYKGANPNTSTFSLRWMRVIPVRVG